MPPATSTRPSGSGAATAPARGTDIEPIPAELKLLVAGSKTSALEPDAELPNPPATSTLPSGSGAATASPRGTDIEPTPAELKLLVAGSKISALERPCPPATSTRPSGSGAATASARYGTDIEPIPAELKVPVAGLKTSALASGPATSTRPSGRGAATAPMRSTDMEPVGLKKPGPAALACGANPSTSKDTNATGRSTRRRWRKARGIPVMAA